MKLFLSLTILLGAALLAPSESFAKKKNNQETENRALIHSEQKQTSFDVEDNVVRMELVKLRGEQLQFLTNSKKVKISCREVKVEFKYILDSKFLHGRVYSFGLLQTDAYCLERTFGEKAAVSLAISCEENPNSGDGKCFDPQVLSVLNSIENTKFTIKD